MKRLAVIYLMLILILIPLTEVNCGSRDNPKDIAAIKELIRDYFDATNEGNYSLAMTYWTGYINGTNSLPSPVEDRIAYDLVNDFIVKEIKHIIFYEYDDVSTASLTVILLSDGTSSSQGFLVSKLEDGSWKLFFILP